VTDRRAMVVLLGLLSMTGCARLMPENLPRAAMPADVPHVRFEIVAQGGRCTPSVLAADRQGRAVVLTFQVTSVDRAHFFLVPGASIRKEIPANTRVEISWLADRSGVHEYACTSGRWIGPLTPTGKLAVK